MPKHDRVVADSINISLFLAIDCRYFKAVLFDPRFNTNPAIVHFQDLKYKTFIFESAARHLYFFENS